MEKKKKLYVTSQGLTRDQINIRVPVDLAVGFRNVAKGDGFNPSRVLRALMRCYLSLPALRRLEVMREHDE